MKKLVGALVATIAAMGVQATGSWEQFHGTSGNNGRAEKGPDLRTHNTPRFEANVEPMMGFGFGPSAAGPVVMDGKVFVYSDSGFMQAFDETTGGLVWKTPIAAFSFGSWSSPSASAGKVYMGSGETVYCFDAKDGAILWEYTLTGPDLGGQTYGEVVNASVTIAEDIGLCYMHTYGSFGGGTRLHAINTADGIKAWTLDIAGQGQGHVAYNPAKKWVYTTTGSYGGRGAITAIDAVTGDPLWTSAGSFDSASFGGIAFDAGLGWVVAAGYSFGGKSGLLICDAADGSTVLYTGDYTILDGDYTPTIGEDGTIYVASGFFDQQTVAIDGKAGTFNGYLWESDYGFGNWCASLVYAQDIGDGTGALYAPYEDWMTWSYGYGMLCAKTGATLAIVPKGGGNAALANGNLYFVTDASTLVAYGPWKHTVEVMNAASYGSVSPAEFKTMKDGESATFTFSGREVADVLVNGVSVGAVNSYTFADVQGVNTLEVRFKPSPFASFLVEELTHGPYSMLTPAGAPANSAPWRFPIGVVGKPNVADQGDFFDGSGRPVRPVSMVWPAWNRGVADATHIGTRYADVPPSALRYNGVTILPGAQTVVGFDDKVGRDARNPFGIDFIVHGNAFFTLSGGGTAGINANMSTTRINNNGSVYTDYVIVSVAQYPEGPWYTYATPTADGLYPTQPYAWNNGGWDYSTEQDWTKPVDPALKGADFGGKTVVEAIALYDGSAGGTGFSLAETGFEWIRYVKFTTQVTKGGEICGVVAVTPFLGTYPLTVVPSIGGSLSIASGDYDSGTPLTVAATPKPGFAFSHWKTLPFGVASSTDTATFTVNRAITLEAVFLEYPASLEYDDWIEHYALLTKDAVNYREWLIGVAPSSGEDLVLFLEMDGGEPRFRWTPNLKGLRHYTLEGRASLSEGGWDTADEDSRFFRVRVKTPDATEENWTPASDGSGNVRIKQ